MTGIFKFKSHSIVRHAVFYVAIVLLAKWGAHWIGWEVVTINPLLSALIAANVFLMGFLLSGVITDYKESEKLPGDLAIALDSIVDELSILKETKKDPAVQDGIGQILRLSMSIVDWMLQRRKISEVMDDVAGLSRLFPRLDPLLPANYVARLKQEQSNLRHCLIRVDAIRETSFIPSGYVLSEIVTVMLVIALVLCKIEPFMESMFFVGTITFLFSFLGLLIRDLDNPFGYGDEESSEDVSLKPLHSTVERLRRLAAPSA